jgi:hypothetical protein
VAGWAVVVRVVDWEAADSAVAAMEVEADWAGVPSTRWH